MGAKYASLHFRTDEPDMVLAKLKKEFNKKQKKGMSEKDEAFLKIMEAFANQNLETIEDDGERERKKQDIENFLEYCKRGLEGSKKEPATIVVREHFVSLYHYDKLRPENIENEFREFSYLCKTPTLAFSVFDDANIAIYAVCDMGEPNVRGARGFYYFDYEDIEPADASEICDILDAPFLESAIAEVLSCEDGYEMAEVFEEKTGLQGFMDEEMCRTAGMKQKHKWSGAIVFSADVI